MSNYYRDSGYDNIKREAARMVDLRNRAQRRIDREMAVLVPLAVIALLAVLIFLLWHLVT